MLKYCVELITVSSTDMKRQSLLFIFLVICEVKCSIATTSVSFFRPTAASKEVLMTTKWVGKDQHNITKHLRWFSTTSSNSQGSIMSNLSSRSSSLSCSFAMPSLNLSSSAMRLKTINGLDLKIAKMFTSSNFSNRSSFSEQDIFF